GVLLNDVGRIGIVRGRGADAGVASLGGIPDDLLQRSDLASIDVAVHGAGAGTQASQPGEDETVGEARRRGNAGLGLDVAGLNISPGVPGLKQEIVSGGDPGLKDFVVRDPGDLLVGIGDAVGAPSAFGSGDWFAEQAVGVGDAAEGSNHRLDRSVGG